jgi:spore germination cell wall hydrolase CwlJ-like protein
MSDRDLDIDVMARTLWGEARGEGLLGMEAVANVIMNRVALSNEKGGYWWGNSVTDVCQKPFQFSCWNTHDPNRAQMLILDPSDKIFAAALDIAADAVYGTLKDATGGATSYYANTMAKPPDWTNDMIQTCIIRHHTFYKLAEA